MSVAIGLGVGVSVAVGLGVGVGVLVDVFAAFAWLEFVVVAFTAAVAGLVAVAALIGFRSVIDVVPGAEIAEST